MKLSADSQLTLVVLVLIMELFPLGALAVIHHGTKLFGFMLGSLKEEMGGAFSFVWNGSARKRANGCHSNRVPVLYPSKRLELC